MRVYTVHTHPSKPAEDIAFVKEGLCWPGLIIPLLWLLYRGLWIPLIGYLAALGAINALAAGVAVNPQLATIATLGLQLYIGLEGNNLRRWVLQGRSYHFDDVVVAANLAEAEQKYFSDYTEPEAPSPPSAAEARQPGLPV